MPYANLATNDITQNRRKNHRCTQKNDAARKSAAYYL